MLHLVLYEPKLADFEDILIQEEKKQTDFLDDDYEQSFFRPSFEDKPTWRVPPEDVINNKEWMKHSLAYRQVASGVDATIGYTNRKVVRARTGTPGQYITFGDQRFSSSFWDQPKIVRMTSCQHSKSFKDPGVIDASADCSRPLTNKTRIYCWSEPSKEFSRRSKMANDSMLVTHEALQETNTKIINLLWDLEMKDTLLKIRSRDQEPKAIPRVGALEKGQNTGLETHRFADHHKSPQKNEQKVSTVSSSSTPTSASEIYKFLTRRSKKRDQLLSPTGLHGKQRGGP